ncbi:hypothetical protein PMI09_00652 [Rhizobium sp. CF122]|nr:hypothetical protein PMI09_00652 [Rhizobium sp. CF122]
MPGSIEEKARRKAEIAQSGARGRGGNDRAGNNETSCGLLRALWARQGTCVRPGDTLGPVIGKPLKSALKCARRKIATSNNVVEFSAAIENDRRHPLTPDARGFSVGISQSDNLLS